MRRVIERALFLAGLALAGAAFACPVCGYATKQQEAAYLLATGAMTLTPLLVVGGVVGWIVLQVRRGEKSEPEAPRAAPSPAQPLGPDGALAPSDQPARP